MAESAAMITLRRSLPAARPCWPRPCSSPRAAAPAPPCPQPRRRRRHRPPPRRRLDTSRPPRPHPPAATTTARSTRRSRHRSSSSAASRPKSPVVRDVLDEAGLRAYVVRSFGDNNPGDARQEHRGALQGAAAHAAGRLAREPVRRAATPAGRRPLRRQDQAAVRDLEVGRDRSDREGHLRPRVHARAAGPDLRPHLLRGRREGPDGPDAGAHHLVEGDAYLRWACGRRRT